MDILIIDPLEPGVIDWLEARHSVRCSPELAQSPEAFRRGLADVRALIAPPGIVVDHAALVAAPHLTVVAHTGASADHIDADSCARAGVAVVGAPNAAAAAEAEFMIGAMLQLLRRVPVLDSEGQLVGRELGGASVGLIGMTPTMRPLARLLGAFGTRVYGYHPSMHASDPLWARWHIDPLGLRELVEQSDAVCVMLTYYSRFKGLLGERFLPFCKPNQVLVSVTDSNLFEEYALAEALNSGRMAAAWFDSVDPAMLEPGRPLAGLATLQVSPGIARITREARIRSAWTVAHRIHEILGAATSQLDFKATVRDVPLDFAADEAPD
jgi:phosphoglycerate dehydrogenase-like enzyme